MAKHRTAIVRRSGSRRKSLWLSFQPATFTEVAVGGTLVFTLNAAALVLAPFTIVRSRFSLFLVSDQSAAAERQVAGFGLSVVSSQAAAIGITAMPTPITDLGSSLFFAHQLLMTAGSAVNDGVIGQSWQLDSKAMRKVENQDDIAVTTEFSTAGSGYTMVVGGRILIKLN